MKAGKHVTKTIHLATVNETKNNTRYKLSVRETDKVNKRYIEASDIKILILKLEIMKTGVV